MEIIKRQPRKEAHPYIPELKELYRQGRITRKEFLRNATLLGMSFAAASAFLASCAPKPTEAPTPVPPTATPVPPTATPVPPTATPVPPTATPAPTTAPAAGPKRGGVLRIAGPVHKITHPAQYSWVVPSNQTRMICEYLTYTDKDNITHPYLLEKWEASEDLLTWTLYLRKNVTWNNGDKFTADDVVFTMNQWLDPDVGSSILGLMSYLTPENIEKVDDYTVRLHLSRPEIAVPEHLFHYPAQILHAKTFEGDIIKAPVGTGPYLLEEYVAGQVFRLKRRPDYWQMGADGKPLPYLDGMVWNDMGTELEPQIAALAAGEIDMIDLGDAAGLPVYLALKDNPNVQILRVTTAVTRVLRMRVDMDPWTDVRVRQALKLCQDRKKILQLAFFGEGLEGQDCHVAPVHPEYCPIETPKYDPEKAKALLAEAGYPDGIDVEIAVGADWPEVVTYAETLKEDAAPAGIRLKINSMPTSQYWDLWTEVALGITPWTHRPLGTMVLNLGYTADAQGNPVPWNETRWVDEEFVELLNKANGTLDVEARRKIMCDLERIQQERGPIGIAFWMNVWMALGKKVRNAQPHPTSYMLFNEVWLEEA